MALNCLRLARRPQEFSVMKTMTNWAAMTEEQFQVDGRCARDVIEFAHAHGIVGRVIKTNRISQDRIYLIGGEEHNVRSTVAQHEGR